MENFFLRPGQKLEGPLLGIYSLLNLVSGSLGWLLCEYRHSFITRHLMEHGKGEEVQTFPLFTSHFLAINLIVYHWSHHLIWQLNKVDNFRLIVLLLIRKSISSLREHIEKVTERLPWYHDDDDLLSNHSTATSPPLHHKDITMESMVGEEVWPLSFPYVVVVTATYFLNLTKFSYLHRKLLTI